MIYTIVTLSPSYISFAIVCIFAPSNLLQIHKNQQSNCCKGNHKKESEPKVRGISGRNNKGQLFNRTHFRRLATSRRVEHERNPNRIRIWRGISARTRRIEFIGRREKPVDRHRHRIRAVREGAAGSTLA